MTNSCALKLTRRWLILFFAVGAASHVIFYFLNGRMPKATTYPTASFQSAELPIILPRFIDLFVMLIPLGICMFLTFSTKPRDQSRYRRYRVWKIKASASVACGWVCGVFGAMIVLGCGVQGAVIGSLITGAVIAGITINWFVDDRKELEMGPHREWVTNQVTLTIWFAILFIWGVTTYAYGAVPGVIYAVLLCGSFITYYAIISTWVLVRRTGPGLVKGFERTMLRCDPAEESCDQG